MTSQGTDERSEAAEQRTKQRKRQPSRPKMVPCPVCGSRDLNIHHPGWHVRGDPPPVTARYFHLEGCTIKDMVGRGWTEWEACKSLYRRLGDD